MIIWAGRKDFPRMYFYPDDEISLSTEVYYE